MYLKCVKTTLKNLSKDKNGIIIRYQLDAILSLDKIISRLYTYRHLNNKCQPLGVDDMHPISSNKIRAKILDLGYGVACRAVSQKVLSRGATGNSTVNTYKI